MSLSDTTRAQIDELVNANQVMLFMKGDRQQPQCGFSATVIKILDSMVPDYTTVNVLEDPELREGIKLYSSWPTIPQLYVKGEFVGGSDIIQELFDSGELQQSLGIETDPSKVEPPSITVTPAAADALKQAVENNGGDGRALHLTVDARFQNNLYMGPPSPVDLEVEAGGITLRIDPMSAQRANGLVIDMVETDQGTGFQIENPNAPQVAQLNPKELKALLDAGERLELIDVRTPAERATASIPGAALYTEEEDARLQALPRDTKIVFHCHHGGRSQQAALHFAQHGFTNVHNLAGGIDAWSQQVDPSVPRY